MNLDIELNLSKAVALVCGIIFGPVCAQFIDVSKWGNESLITHEFTRVVIAIQVMATGVALPKAYLRKELSSILVLLGPVMLFMWLVSGLFVWALVPGLTFVSFVIYLILLINTKQLIVGSIDDCCLFYAN